MGRIRLIQIVGKTTEDQLVLSGLYKYFETTGLPLDIILDQVKTKNMVPSWKHLYNEMIQAGMDHDRAISRISLAIFDVYGREYRNNVIGFLP